MKLILFAASLVAIAGFLFTSPVRAADETMPMEPVKSVLDHYLKIQAELAKDSINGIDEQAKAIAKAVRGDDMKMLSTDVADQADMLAMAKDLKSAREAFKPLSNSLIKYLTNTKASRGEFRQAYCPMANASWLQTGKEISNPYLGKELPTCGEFKNWE